MIVASALDEVFSRCKSEDRCALIAYVVAGDPNLETSRAVIDAIVEAGVDILELGIPYGDPLADGPTIAASAQRALAGGMNIDTALRLVPQTKVPTILFTYVNPVMQYGVEKFAVTAKRHGAVGAIVPDIPLEEAYKVREGLHKNGLVMPMLVAPTTPDARAKEIASVSDGFLYLVSRLGVTGAKEGLDAGAIRTHVERLRGVTDRPIAVGFGISRAPQVVAIRDSIDGVIVGSAVIEAYAAQKTPAAAAAAAMRFVRLLRMACKRAAHVAPAAADAAPTSHA
jgi:tryptophan synthase alpha chain